MTFSSDLRLLKQRWLNDDKIAWKAFVVYGLVYSVMSPVVPLAVQGVISNWAFIDMGVNLVPLLMAIVGILALIQIARYAQILLAEFLERRIVARLVPQFQGVSETLRPYFFEIALIPKSLSKWAIEGLELALVLIIAPVMLLIYHPVFGIFALLLWGLLYYIGLTGKSGLSTALEESTEKYTCWESLNQNGFADSSSWLTARAKHFKILQRQIRALLIAQVVGPSLLLVAGAVLFSLAHLSLGQFVAVELIGSGLFATLGRLAKFTETHYALSTSLIKLEYALGRSHE